MDTTVINEQEIEALFNAGVHVGYSKARRHPKMKENIFSTRNNLDIFDLRITLDRLRRAEEFLKALGRGGELILWVGAKPAASSHIERAAEKTGMPYVSRRWLGGTLTNFKIISDRLLYWSKLEEEAKSADFEKYSKKERLLKTIELEKLSKVFGGIRKLKRLPSAVVIVDPNKEKTAMSEARRKNIPVVAILNSDCNCAGIGYPIPANDNASLSVGLILEKLASAYEDGLKTPAEAPVKSQ